MNIIDNVLLVSHPGLHDLFSDEEIILAIWDIILDDEVQEFRLKWSKKLIF